MQDEFGEGGSVDRIIIRLLPPLIGASQQIRLDTINPESVLAVVAVIALCVNTWLAFAGHRQATTAKQMHREIIRDRELAHWPYLVYKDAKPDSKSSQLSYEVRNVGRGPAIRAEFFRYDAVHRQWELSENFHLATGAAERITLGDVTNAEINRRQQKELAGIDVLKAPTTIQTVPICFDQFGKLHRFNPAQSEPEIWHVKRARWVKWSQWTG